LVAIQLRGKSAWFLGPGWWYFRAPQNDFKLLIFIGLRGFPS
jgi:hypothetical protein